MSVINIKKLITILVVASLILLLINQVMAIKIKRPRLLNNPPFVTVAVIPTEGFVNEIFSICVTAGDTDGYLTGALVLLNGNDISSEFRKLNSTTWLYDFVPSTTGDYIIVCTVYDNRGSATSASATFKVTDVFYSIRSIRLNDDLPQLTDWEDYDFFANMKGSDGKDYTIDFYLIYKPTNTGRSKIKFDNEPSSIYFNETHKIIEENSFIRAKVDSSIKEEILPGLAIYTLKQGFRQGLNIQWLKVEFTFQPPNLHIVKAFSQDNYLELKFYTRGMPFWYNQGVPFYHDRLGDGMGYEIFSKVEGTLTNSGNVVQLNGYGIYEHFWSDRWDCRNVDHMDWLFFNFDELYGILFALDGYTDGGIYLMREEQYLVVENFSIEYLDWAYNPIGEYYVPTEISFSASTRSGTLEVIGQARGFQQMGMGYEPYYNIGDISMNGTFTYSNGTIMTLTNGSGLDQIILRET